MSVIDEILKASESYARAFNRGDLAMPPKRKLAIVTCMDARILPSRLFGLDEGDAHVIRNAGGRAKEALRSLVISQRLLGTNEIAIVHHTDCGMLTFTNDQLREKVREDLGADASGIDFLPFTDVEQSVRDDLSFLRLSSLIPKTIVARGFVYDVRSGQVTEVTPEPTSAAAGAR